MSFHPDELDEATATVLDGASDEQIAAACARKVEARLKDCTAEHDKAMSTIDAGVAQECLRVIITLRIQTSRRAAMAVIAAPYTAAARAARAAHLSVVALEKAAAARLRFLVFSRTVVGKERPVA